MYVGIAFVVLFVVGMLLGRDTPSNDAADQEWTDWFSDSGNRTGQVISAVLLTLAAMAILVFVTGLVRRAALARPERESVTLARTAGIVLAVAIGLGGIAVNQMGAAIQVGDIPVPSADVLRTGEQLGFGILLLLGGVAAAVTVAAMTVAMRGTGLVPAWLITAGYVVAVLLLLSLLFVPMVLLPLWVLVVAIVTGTRKSPA
jgi:hypothetical protein